MALENAVLANDKFSAQTRTVWIASPADTTLAVTAIPTNLPTILVVGWKTQYETVFKITGTSGTNSSNYALTGVTRLKGANVNLPEGLSVNCLNNEEYFNQYADLLGEIQEIAEDAQEAAEGAASSAITVNSIVSSATPTPIIATDRNLFSITAQAATGAIAAPTGMTPTDGQTLIVRIVDNGGAQTLSWNSGAGGYAAGGNELPLTTVAGKYMHVGFIYVASNSLNKWICLGVQQEE